MDERKPGDIYCLADVDLDVRGCQNEAVARVPCNGIIGTGGLCEFTTRCKTTGRFW